MYSVVCFIWKDVVCLGCSGGCWQSCSGWIDWWFIYSSSSSHTHWQSLLTRLYWSRHWRWRDWWFLYAWVLWDSSTYQRYWWFLHNGMCRCRLVCWSQTRKLGCCERGTWWCRLCYVVFSLSLQKQFLQILGNKNYFSCCLLSLVCWMYWAEDMKMGQNVELHLKLKLSNILKFKEHYSFTTVLLHMPVSVLVEKKHKLVCKGLFCSWLLAVRGEFPLPSKKELHRLCNACCND